MSQEKLRDATLVFLIKKTQEQVGEICLAMKKRGFGVGRWNGVGGKVEEGETIAEARVREAVVESGIKFESFNKIAELSFYFPHNSSWDQKVHVYFCDVWQGEPTESEEMKPQWFLPDVLPFDLMWPDDRYWVPEVLAGKLVKARFVFGEGDIVQDQDVWSVDML